MTKLEFKNCYSEFRKLVALAYKSGYSSFCDAMRTNTVYAKCLAKDVCPVSIKIYMYKVKNA